MDLVRAAMTIHAYETSSEKPLQRDFLKQNGLREAWRDGSWDDPIDWTSHRADVLRYLLLVEGDMNTDFIPPPTGNLVQPYYPQLGV